MDLFVGEILMLRRIEPVPSSYTRFINYTIMERSFQVLWEVTAGSWGIAILRNVGKYLPNYTAMHYRNVTLRTERRVYP
jgi:hypothetical protein